MKKEQIKVSWLSLDIVWENPKENLTAIEQFLSTNSTMDILVLPEMVTTGFTGNAEACAETMDGPSVLVIKSLAASHKVAIACSLVITENEKFYNRFMFFHPEGRIDTYDKHHLFTYAGEDEVYSAGSSHLVVDYKGWSIACFICYDLRFPAWIRRGALGSDLAIFVANWPELRVEAWTALLKARAIENQVYVLGVNRTGEDGKGLRYCESSQLYHPDGSSIDIEDSTSQISKSALDSFRERFPFFQDADRFQFLS